MTVWCGAAEGSPRFPLVAAIATVKKLPRGFLTNP
jgi:hypothetical protein